MKCCDIKLAWFTQRVTIERLSTTRDNQGGREETWAAPDADAEDIFAWIRPLTGSEARQAERVSPSAVYECYIHYRADSNGAPYYTPADRLIWRGRTHNIIAAFDVESESLFMRLLLNEGALS